MKREEVEVVLASRTDLLRDATVLQQGDGGDPRGYIARPWFMVMTPDGPKALDLNVAGFVPELVMIRSFSVVDFIDLTPEALDQRLTKAEQDWLTPEPGWRWDKVNTRGGWEFYVDAEGTTVFLRHVMAYSQLPFEPTAKIAQRIVAPTLWQRLLQYLFGFGK